MRVWIAEGALPETGAAGLSTGRWQKSPDNTMAGTEETLVTVADATTDIAGAEALLISAGRALQDDLLARVGDADCPVLVCINGMGESGLTLVRSTIPARNLVLLYEASGATATDIMEQIAWLSRQAESFALAGDDQDQLVMAAAAGADALLVKNANDLNLDTLSRITAAGERGARPQGPHESDQLAGEELCLTVSRQLNSGDAISQDDLGVAVTDYRGLSPTMKTAITGQRLRYDLEPGEAIHFGHLDCRGPAKPPERGNATDPDTAPKISVIIRTKNEAKWLGACLHAVAHQDYPLFEIIVVDNDSDDGSRDIAAEYGCTLVDISDADFNFSRALNRGIEASNAPYLAILSGHCVPANEQWLARLAMNLNDPRVVAVYGRQEPLPDSSPVDKRDLWTTFGLDRKIQKRDYFFHNANSMIRRSAWEDLPFNEQIHGVEDRDWAKKVLRDEARIIYEPGASVFHHHGIHHDGSLERVDRVVKVIELIQKDLT